MRKPIVPIAFLGALILSLVLAGEPAVAVNIKLDTIDAKDAFMILRSIVPMKGKTEIVDDHNIRITETADAIKDAQTVVDMLEHPGALEDENLTRTMTDGSAVACVRLRHAPVTEALMTLRKEIDIARVAIVRYNSTIVVRDKPERVLSALGVLRRMDSPSESEASPANR